MDMQNLALQLEMLAGLGSWERPDNAKDVILEGLGHQDSALRLNALEIAAEELDPDLTEVIVRLLETDPEHVVRARAAIALGPALEMMSTEEDWEEPELEDLPMSVDRFHDVERCLEKIYRDADEPKQVRRRVLEAAVRSPRDWHKGVIRSAWASEDPEWQLTAVFCMGCIAGFEDQILEALDSDSPELKTEAVRAAGAMGLKAAGRVLAYLAAADDTPREMRLAAIEALGTTPTPESAEVLEMLLLSDDEEIAELARAAFDELAIWQHVDDHGDDFAIDMADDFDD